MGFMCLASTVNDRLVAELGSSVIFLGVSTCWTLILGFSHSTKSLQNAHLCVCACPLVCVHDHEAAPFSRKDFVPVDFALLEANLSFGYISES